MEEEQQPQEQQSMPYYQPTIMPSEKADLFDKIRPEEVVELIKQKLMGKEWNEQKQMWEMPKWKTRGLTEQGASEISTLLLSVSSKSVAISKLNDSEIRLRTRAIHRAAMRMCVTNWIEYGITSPDQIDLVSQIVVSIAFITLKQPENAGIRELIKGTTQESKIINEQGKPSGGITSLFRR